MSWRRFWHRRRDAELSQEIESYIAHEVDDNLARGMSADESRSAAQRKFGNATLVKETVYEMNPLHIIESVRQDVTFGLRQLWRNPAFAGTSIFILALGIATTTAIFSITYGVLLRDLPYEQPDRLVTLASAGIRDASQRSVAGAADYFDWRRQQQVFEDLALTRPVANFNLTGVGEPERLQGARATASLFSTLHARPLFGRTFTEDEQLDPGKAASVAVLSYALWQRRFASDPAIVGRKLLLNGQPHEVLGVMGPSFQYPTREFELWTPLYLPAAALEYRRDYSYLCIARLAPGVTLEQARAHMDVIAGNLSRQYPQTNKDSRVFVGPMLSEMTGSVRRALWVLFAAVGVLFAVGCVNLANLLLARAANRRQRVLPPGFSRRLAVAARSSVPGRSHPSGGPGRGARHRGSAWAAPGVDSSASREHAARGRNRPARAGSACRRAAVDRNGVRHRAGAGRSRPGRRRARTEQLAAGCETCCSSQKSHAPWCCWSAPGC